MNLIFILLLLAAACTAQAQSAAPGPQAPSSALTASAMAELPAKLQLVSSAQQTGDAAKIAAANRDMIAVGLRAMAELKLAQGDTKQAIDLYQRSLAIDDTTQTHISLALAYMRAQRIDDALAQIEPVIKADPQNADAWNVQGKLLMDKKSYAPASEALARSLQLQGNPLVAYALATAFLNLKQNTQAEAIFKQIIESAGDSASAHIMVGRAYQNADQMDDAVREFNRAVQIDAKGSRAHYFLGLLYLAQNEWVATPQAREQFTEEVKINSTDFFGNFFLGYIDNADKLYDDSDRYLKTAARDKPEWPEAYLYMGLNAYARHDNKSAEELLRKAIQLTGDDTARNNYQIRRAYYVLGRICFQSDRKEEAAKYTKIFSDMQAKTEEISRAASPASKTQGTMGSGMAAMPSVPTSAMIDPAAQPGDTAPQLSTEQKAEIIEGERRLGIILGSAYNDLGTADARQKKYSDALAYFQQAERWDPALPHLMRNVGFAAFRAGQHAEAARALKTAQQQDPDDKMIPPMLAMSQFSADEYAEAAKTFDQMGDAAYGDPRGTYAYAVSLARSNQPDKAKPVVDRMAQRQLPPDGLLLLGEAYSEIGDQRQALASFQKALQANPSLLRAHYFAGMALLKLKQPVQAVAEFEAEVKLNPQDAEAQFQLGKTLLEQGKTRDAISYLEAAAKLNADLEGVHGQLALAYRKLGRTADADREAKLASAAKDKREAPTGAPK